MALCDRLRLISLYPALMSTFIEPLAMEIASATGITDSKDVFSLMTMHELLSASPVDTSWRKQERDAGKYFVYRNRGGSELVEWVGDPLRIVRALERTSTSYDLCGSAAFPGRVSGRARVILGNDVGIGFDEGDILISVSTNPALLPLMRKAGAIVTDEGGMMCHAAILARELKKPCVVGVRDATELIRDGEMIEVDAGSGRVRPLVPDRERNPS